ncbi:MAG: hypothetical protein ACLP29_10970 [Dissulfurispiraceae bacterium]
MKKILTVVVAMLFVVSLAMVASAAEMYSLKGSVVKVDSSAMTVTVKSVEGVKEAADNRWKGEIPFATDTMTKISMGKATKTFEDIKVGQKVKVKFHEKDGNPVADKIMIYSHKKSM